VPVPPGGGDTVPEDADVGGGDAVPVGVGVRVSPCALAVALVKG
jgi:hypothetical protein